MIKPGIYREIATGALEFRGELAEEMPEVYEREEQLSIDSGADDKNKDYGELNKSWAAYNKK